MNRNSTNVYARSVVRVELPTTQDIAWEYIVNLKDCEEWLESEETDGLAILIQGTQYAGQLIPNPESGLPPIELAVTRSEYANRIDFSAAADPVAISPDSRKYFPFKAMDISILIEPEGDSSTIRTTTSMHTDGFLNWLIVKLLVLPFAKHSTKKGYRRIIKHLNNKNAR